MVQAFRGGNEKLLARASVGAASPMIHFFPTWSREAAASPFGDALRQTGAAHRIFATKIGIYYRSRVGLLLVFLPQLAWFALRSSIRSLALSRPAPDAVVLGSDIEVLVFAAMRLPLLRWRTRIVLNSFIFTDRRSPWLQALRLRYYRFVMRRVALAIVHSKLERDRYATLFAGTGTRFAFVAFGLNVDGRRQIMEDAAAAPAGAVVVTAGRSGRDYATLFAAMAGLSAELRVICDFAGALPPAPHPANVTVLGACHGTAYLRELAGATVVAVPVKAADISVGQMVLIQAMALGRAVVVHDTPTIRDYVTDGHDALLVKLADPQALHDAIARLLADPALRARLGANAMATFETRFSTGAAVRLTVDAIAEAIA